MAGFGDLSAQRFLVTGASSGIGRECCVLISELGGVPVLAARDAVRLEETARLLPNSRYGLAPFDLAKPDDIPGWLKRVAGEHGPFAGLVHCAGVRATLPLRACASSHFEETYRINVVAGAMLVKGFRQKDVASRPSSVVLISSVCALMGEACASAYAANKGAINSLVRSLAVELAGEGIRVNSVAPGYVPTTMTAAINRLMTEDQMRQLAQLHPLGLGTPRDVANAIVFLLADTARWITGTTLVVDGGYTA